jgi:hypothetical protein
MAEAAALGFSGLQDLLTHRGTQGTIAGGGQFLERDGRDLDVQIDAVQERAADPADVTFDVHRGALARPPAIAEVAARARVHGGDQDEACWKRARMERAGDGDAAFFEPLAQHLQAPAIELRQLSPSLTYRHRTRESMPCRLHGTASQFTEPCSFPTQTEFHAVSGAVVKVSC